MCKAHRLLYHSTLVLRVTKKKTVPAALAEEGEGRLVVLRQKVVCLEHLREAGPPNHHGDKVDSDQQVVNKELSICCDRRWCASNTCGHNQHFVKISHHGCHGRRADNDFVSIGHH